MLLGHVDPHALKVGVAAEVLLKWQHKSLQLTVTFLCIEKLLVRQQRQAARSDRQHAATDSIHRQHATTGSKQTVEKISAAGEKFPDDERECVHIDLFEGRLTVLQIDSAVQYLRGHVTHCTNLAQSLHDVYGIEREREGGREGEGGREREREGGEREREREGGEREREREREGE